MVSAVEKKRVGLSEEFQAILPCESLPFCVMKKDFNQRFKSPQHMIMICCGSCVISFMLLYLGYCTLVYLESFSVAI